MDMEKIVVVGARENNLKNITVEIPRNRLVVVTGLSGSGKSSLAFDTIFAEGQRRYVESLSSYARQFLGQMDKPDVDHVEGLSPAISIDQKSTSRNPRSTVGTVTEIYDYMRVLFARVGIPYSPATGLPISRQTPDEIVDRLLRLPEGTKLQVLAPVVRGRKGTYQKDLKEIQAQGFVRARVDGEVYDLGDDIPMARYEQHTIEVVVDRIVLKDGVQRRLTESIETSLKLAKGLVTVTVQEPGQEEPRDETYSEHYSCPVSGFTLPELEPRMFSFNSPFGACPECSGLGTKTEFDPELIIPDPSLPLRDGAIKPFVYKSGEVKDWWPQVLDAVGDVVGFDAALPVSRLSEEQMAPVWNGLPDPVTVTVNYGRGTRKFNTTWAGVIATLRKKYDSTESEWVRNDLQQYMSTRPCPACGGQRLKPESLTVKLDELTISQIAAMSVRDALTWFDALPGHLTDRQLSIGERAVREITERLRFLFDVGLGYLTLERSATTLAGGEAQRIRLATQIGSGLMGCLYVLDEPSIGLHQRDNERLIGTLKRLRDLGNTVLVVEHDEDTMRSADWLIDLGPGAGEHGGYVVNEGTWDEFVRNDSPTSRFLRGDERIEVPGQRRVPQAPAPKKEHVPGWLTLRGARGHNLKNVDVSFPLGRFVAVTGVSGSGKSTLVQDTLFPRLMYELFGTRTVWEPHDHVEGVQQFDKVIDIDQSPIGRTPRSNPATYTGTFDMIRALFAMTPDSKMRGYTQGRFSFNVKGGRCEACKGDGIIKIEMHFLPDVYVPCEVCKGKRYNRETLEVKYKGKSIADVLEMTIEEATEFFSPIPKIHRKLVTLLDVGLGYIRMGQPATTLSGGEAQRVKLAEELSKRATGRTLYILDEPTTGLHFEDVRRLLTVLHRLVDTGNTVIVIEHNLDVIKTADWVVEMGPEGGSGGGEVVFTGTPEELVKQKKAPTARFLAPLLERGRVSVT